MITQKIARCVLKSIRILLWWTTNHTSLSKKPWRGSAKYTKYLIMDQLQKIGFPITKHNNLCFMLLNPCTCRGPFFVILISFSDFLIVTIPKIGFEVKKEKKSLYRLVCQTIVYNVCFISYQHYLFWEYFKTLFLYVILTKKNFVN